MKKIILLSIIAFLGFTTANAQVGIGTTTPDPSAKLDVTATDKGFLPPRLTTAERDAITSPAEGLTIYNTDSKCLETWNATDWISICDGSVVTTLPSSNCPDTTTTIVDVVAAGHTWMDRNLGASQAATSSTDANSYGYLYQWGRCGDGHQLRTAGTYTGGQVNTAVPNAGNPWDGLFIETGLFDWLQTQDNTLWQGVTGTNNPCPAGYRLPSDTELQDLDNSISPQSAAGAFASPLKLPMAGSRNKNSGNLSNVGNDAWYWGGSFNGSNQVALFVFGVNDNPFSPEVDFTSGRANAHSVRCIKD